MSNVILGAITLRFVDGRSLIIKSSSDDRITVDDPSDYHPQPGQPEPPRPLIEALLPGAVPGELLEVAGTQAFVRIDTVGPWHVLPHDATLWPQSPQNWERHCTVWVQVPCCLLPLHISARGAKNPGDGDHVWLAARYEAREEVLRLVSLALAAGSDTTYLLWAKQPQSWRTKVKGNRQEALNLSTELSFWPSAKQFAVGIPHIPRDFLRSQVERELGLQPQVEADYENRGDKFTASWTQPENARRRLCFERRFVAVSSTLYALSGVGPLQARQIYNGGKWWLDIKCEGPAAARLLEQSWRGLINADTAQKRGERSFTFDLEIPKPPSGGASLKIRLQDLQHKKEFCYQVFPATWSQEAAPALDARLVFRSILTHTNQPLTVPAKIFIFAKVDSGKVQLRAWEADKIQQSVRMGSLDFHITGLANQPQNKSPKNSDDSDAKQCTIYYTLDGGPLEATGTHPFQIQQPLLNQFILGPERFKTGIDDIQAGRLGRTAVDPTPTDNKNDKNLTPLLLRVNKVAPGGIEHNREDVELTQNSEEPLLVPLTADNVDNDEPANLLLVVAQNFGLQSKHPDLRLSLQVDSTQSVAARRSRPPLRILYLDRTPFFVSLIRTNDLSDFKRDQGADEYAYWALEGITPGWNLRSAAERMDIILPAQGLGEAEEKYREGEGPNDISNTKVADFRLSPPAVVALQASDLPRSYASAPWNVRHLLNSLRDSRVTGLTIDKARLELLYGLSLRFGSIPFLRLAEIFSRLGLPHEVLYLDPPTEFGDKRLRIVDQFVTQKNEWEWLLKTFSSRLAVYEVFDDRQVEFSPDGQLQGFALRGASGQQGLRAYLRKRASLATSFPQTALPTDNDGLTGSFAWAFESRLIYEAIWKNGASSDGDTVEAVDSALARVFFSALGGWGQVQASFDGGRTTIGARVEMGRVSELRIERIGRIANFWNRAKHVIVYRRSVLPSSQFENQQDRLIGRAALRKHEEFIDFIQPNREYPDSEPLSQSAVQPGCLAACSCNERILVDSRWGADVYENNNLGIGWKLPLRVPGARPDVYRQANILLHFHADPSTGSGTVASRIENLENVYFWTDVRDNTGANPDLWSLIPGLDVGFFDVPSNANEVFAPGKDDPSKKSTNEIFDEFGARTQHTKAHSFTYRLGALTHSVNLVGQSPAAGVTADQIGSKLRNVLVSRGQIQSTSKNSVLENFASQFENVVGFIETLHDAVLGSAARTAREHIQTELKNNASPMMAPLKAALDSLGNALPNLAEAYKDRVAKNVQWTLQRAQNGLAGLPGELQHHVSLLTDKLGLTVSSPKDEVDKVIAELEKIADPKGKQRKSLEFVWRSYMSTVDGTVSQLRIALATVNDLRNKLNEAVKTATEQAHDAEAAIKGTNNAVTDLNSLIVLLDRPEFRRLARCPFWQSLPLKVEADIGAAIQKVIELRERLQCAQAEYRARTDRIKFLVEDLQSRTDEALGHFLGVVDQQLANINTLLKSPPDPSQRLKDEFEDEKKAIQENVNNVIEKLKQSAFESAEQLWTEIRRNVDDLGTRASQVNVKERADQISALIQASDLFQKTEDLNARAGQLMEKFKAKLESWVKAADDIELASAWLDDRRQELQHFLQDVRGAIAQEKSELTTLSMDLKQVVTGVRHLSLFRGFGDVPSVPMMDFKGMLTYPLPDIPAERLRTVAYTFLRDTGAKGEKLLMSPVTALVDRAVNAAEAAKSELRLKAQSLEMGVRKITDRIQADINNLGKNIGDVIPDLGGLKLDKLLGDVPLPDDVKKRMEQAVKLTHSFDRTSMTAFADALIDNLSLGSDVSLFAFGPFALRLRRPVLYAHTQIAASADGHVQRQADARLSADWEISFSESPLVTFRDAALRCTNGEIRMDLDPSKLELSSVLKAVSDLCKSFSFGGDTFRAGLDVNLPTSLLAYCKLNLQFPPIAGGAFAITNLRLGAYMNVGLDLSKQLQLFTVAAGLNLARREAPFAVIVFILGGCGWFVLDVIYEVPLSAGQPSLKVTLDVGIGAAAGLGINLGFLEGSILISLAINARAQIIRNSAEQRTDWNIAIVLTFAGRCSILGIIDVDLVICLALTYETGGGLVGSGYVHVEIEICWCFTLSFERSFTYRFGNASGNSAMLEDDSEHEMGIPDLSMPRRRLAAHPHDGLHSDAGREGAEGLHHAFHAPNDRHMHRTAQAAKKFNSQSIEKPPHTAREISHFRFFAKAQELVMS